MKKLFLIYPFILITASCNGQNKRSLNQYTQRKEYGYTDSVKEVITYFCTAKKEKIPNDTVNFIGKSIKQFDKNGDSVEDNTLWNMDENGTRKIKRFYSGKGKNVSLHEVVTIDNKNIVNRNLKYKWIDDFSYTIIDLNEPSYKVTIVLNKDYTFSKTLTTLNENQVTENINTLKQSKKIIKTTTTTITKNENNVIKKEYNIEVVKEYDKFGNPTLIYSYADKDEKQIINVLFKHYKYF